MNQYLLYKFGTGYWREGRCGYTENILEAGIYGPEVVEEFKTSNHSRAIAIEERRVEIERAIERMNGDILRAGGYTLSEYPGDPRD